MFVNPDLLRRLAALVQEASTAITGADLGDKASLPADGLAGSTTDWAARLVGAHINHVAGEIAKNVHDMGVAVRGAGDMFDVTDDALAGLFNRLF